MTGLDADRMAWDPVHRRLVCLPVGGAAVVDLVERLGLDRLRRRCRADGHHELLEALEPA